MPRKERIKMDKKLPLVVLACITLLAPMSMGLQYWWPSKEHVRRIPSPEDFLGYSIGQDYTLTSWTKELEYFYTLDRFSNRVEVMKIGESRLGRPMVIVVISSPDTIARLEYYRSITNKLSDPRVTSPEDAIKLADKGKVIVWLTCDQHSSEFEDTESSMELAYELASRNDERTMNVLDNVITIILPSINPDGHDGYRDWYNTYKNTTYAGTSPPEWGNLVSHDNNRDWDALNLVENQVAFNAILKWKPQIHIDSHMMGTYGYRMFVPPECDPINPHIDPLVQQEKFIIGGDLVTSLERAGLYGVVYEEVYDLFYPGYGDSCPSLHNIVGCTWEIARGPGADPVNIPFERLSSSAKQVGEHQMHPWPGGMWTFKDEVAYRMTAWWALLESAARNKFNFLYNYYLAGRNQVERGKTEAPYAFLIPFYDRDPAYMCDMLNHIIMQGIEVRQTLQPFCYSGVTYPAGTYIVRMDQPYRPMALTLLERQVLTIPYFYDVTAWNYGDMWNIPVVQVVDKSILSVKVSLPLKKALPPKGEVIGAPATFCYVFNHTITGIKAVNELLKKEYSIYFYSGDSKTVGGIQLEPGVVMVPAAQVAPTEMNNLAKNFNLKIYALNVSTSLPVYGVSTKPRIGVFFPQRYGKGTMCWGWANIILSNHNFDFQTINETDIQAGNLINNYDVIIIPDESSAKTIVDGSVTYPLPNGIKKQGLENLKTFVEAGGVLIGFNKGGEVPVRYGFTTSVTLVDTSSVTIPGSILRVNVNTTHFIAYGTALENPIFYEWSPAFLAPVDMTVAQYPTDSSKIWISGYHEGEEALSGNAALVDAPLGDGHVIIFGFDPFYRSQAHGTFLFAFNAIYWSVTQPTTLA